MSKYDLEIDLNNPNSSHYQMIDLVGHNKRVLDVGCATGYLARVLIGRGCRVSGVEFDQDAAEEARPLLEKLLVGDLERLDLVQEFGEGVFDVVVFGDVLEHLRDPLPVLRQARGLLRPGGSVVVSLPNIGHGAVRLALLQGKFEYRSLGLLDTTHLRFFTRESLLRLFDECGLVGVDVRRTTAGLFETELGIKPEDFEPQLVEQILDDPDATTYQFVIRAIPDDGDAAVQALATRVDAMRERQHELERAIERVLAERNQLGVMAHDEREKHLAAEAQLNEVTRERNELGAIAYDEREKHVAAEGRVQELEGQLANIRGNSFWRRLRSR